MLDLFIECRNRMSRNTAPVAVALAAILGSCSNPAPRHHAGVTQLRFATDWNAEAEQGGFYEAMAEGDYAKRGLEVEIVPGGPGVNVPQLLAAGAVDLGIGSNSFVAINLASQAAPVRAVAAFMQKDPQVLIAHRNAGVTSISDFRGHPIYLADASIGSFWPWLKSKYGLDDAQVRKYTFNNGPFIASKQAIQQGYLTSEPYTIEKESGEKPAIWLLSDAGFPGYAGMILATDALIQKNPEAVSAFVQASAEGWRHYLWGDSRPADAMILRFNPEMTKDVLAQARQKLRDFAILGPPGSELGEMSEQRWRSFLGTMAAARIYPHDLDYTKAYTLRFLPSGVSVP